MLASSLLGYRKSTGYANPLGPYPIKLIISHNVSRFMLALHALRIKF